MKIAYNKQKDIQLQAERGISFRCFIDKIKNGEILDDIKNPNYSRYPDQKIFIIELDNYAYLVPYVESNMEIFLKTAYPSRKMTKKYLGDSKNET